MPVSIENFKSAYDQWVKESLADYEAGNTKEIVKKYPFVQSANIPWTPYVGDSSTKTFAIVTSGGFFLKDQQPAFETKSIHGDTSFREIPKTTRQDDLDIAHPHYDHSFAKEDFNIIFPLERFLELEAEGVVGKVAEMNFSLSYVNDVATLVAETIPNLLARIKEQGVDALFLVPAWPKCHQTVGLIQQAAEAEGISTISLGNAPDRMVYIRPPRALLVKFARGSMLGEPGNITRQRRIIMDGLAALQNMSEPGTIQELPYRWKKPDPE